MHNDVIIIICVADGLVMKIDSIVIAVKANHQNMPGQLTS